MDNHYWLSKWEKNDIGFNQPKPHPLLVEYINTLELPAKARIFVPLCGKSVDMLWLLEKGYRVIGIELSTIACEAFFTEHQLAFKLTRHQHLIHYVGENITLICGDFFKLTQKVLGPIDAVYDRAALIALSASRREVYVAHLLRLIPTYAKIFLISLLYDSKEMAGPPFPVLGDEIDHLYGKHLKIQLIHLKAIKKIAPHLQAKGLKKAFEVVYVITFSSNSK